MAMQEGDRSSSRLIREDSVVLDQDTDEQLKCYGYRRCLWKLVVFYALTVLSVGLLYLVTHWKPAWRLTLTKKRCWLRDADAVLLEDPFLNSFRVDIVVRDVSGVSSTAYSSFDNHSKAKAVGRSTVGANEFVSFEPDRINGNADDMSILTTRSRLILRYFDHRQARYAWSAELQNFKRLIGLELGITCQDLINTYTGLTKEEQWNKLQVFGPNTIAVEVKSYPKLFFEEIVNPFYVFQIFSVVLWCSDNYYIYASCIIVISLISLGVELYETRKQRETLRDMVASNEISVSVVLAGGDVCQVQTSDLVPGDVIEIPATGCTMPCDAVLVVGTAIVDESMLTGESIPVTKTQLAPSADDEEYSPDIHKRSTLFCGTRVIQTRFYGTSTVKAVVLRTGFSTAKGELVRSILYPKEIFFKFYQDSVKFIGFLACLATIGMIYSAVILALKNTDASTIVKKVLDVVTIAVPPALPAAMTVGSIYAQRRLKKEGIFCISPQRINLCGKLQCICFDKTGTLTADGLDMSCVLPLTTSGDFAAAVYEPKQLPPRSPLVIAMATCHSLTLIGGELSGDPLDVSMFQALNWALEEPGKDTTKFDMLVPTIVKPITRETYASDLPDSFEGAFEIGIMRQFTFSSAAQCMSVIVRVLNADHMDVYVKGAPEKVASMCHVESLPEDYHRVLQKYAGNGLRVIALASKSLDSKISWRQVQRISRDSVESDLMFVGLVVFENKLKPETTPVIRELHEADIRTVMVTGDNILTAVSVARQCGLVPGGDKLVLVNAHAAEGSNPAYIKWECLEDVDEETHLVADGNTTHQDHESYQSSATALGIDVHCRLAITGRCLAIVRQYFPQLVSQICILGSVFARMSPDQKSNLVEDLQNLGLCVGMCGDGANDCGALRTAHAGISLSEAEASVASPFTSKTANISCIPTVIREGRAALVTSFGVFKYMAMYSIVQFISILILYTSNSYLTDYMFLYIDLFITTLVAIFMGHTGAYKTIVKKRPSSSLVNVSNISSLLIHILLVIAIQAIVFAYISDQPWYVEGNPKNAVSMATTAIFYISCFQYLMLAFALSKGPPYRQRIWTNIPFLVSLILLTFVTILLVLAPAKFVADILQLDRSIPLPFREILLGISLINFFLVLFLESFVADSAFFKQCLRSLCCRASSSKSADKLLIQQVLSDRTWPPVGETTHAVESPHGNCSTVISSVGNGNGTVLTPFPSAANGISQNSSSHGS